MDYFNKYIKYKKKYLNLKNMIGGVDSWEELADEEEAPVDILSLPSNPPQTNVVSIPDIATREVLITKYLSKYAGKKGTIQKEIGTFKIGYKTKKKYQIKTLINFIDIELYEDEFIDFSNPAVDSWGIETEEYLYYKIKIDKFIILGKLEDEINTNQFKFILINPYNFTIFKSIVNRSDIINRIDETEWNKLYSNNEYVRPQLLKGIPNSFYKYSEKFTLISLDNNYYDDNNYLLINGYINLKSKSKDKIKKYMTDKLFNFFEHYDGSVCKYIEPRFSKSLKIENELLNFPNILHDHSVIQLPGPEGSKIFAQINNNYLKETKSTRIKMSILKIDEDKITLEDINEALFDDISLYDQYHKTGKLIKDIINKLYVENKYDFEKMNNLCFNFRQRVQYNILDNKIVNHIAIILTNSLIEMGGMIDFSNNLLIGENDLYFDKAIFVLGEEDGVDMKYLNDFEVSYHIHPKGRNIYEIPSIPDLNSFFITSLKRISKMRETLENLYKELDKPPEDILKNQAFYNLHFDKLKHLTHLQVHLIFTPEGIYALYFDYYYYKMTYETVLENYLEEIKFKEKYKNDHANVWRLEDRGDIYEKINRNLTYDLTKSISYFGNTNIINNFESVIKYFESVYKKTGIKVIRWKKRITRF